MQTYTYYLTVDVEVKGSRGGDIEHDWLRDQLQDMFPWQQSIASGRQKIVATITKRKLSEGGTDDPH